MKKTFTILTLAGVIAVPPLASAITGDAGFSRYQIILDKSPFGKPPPPPKAPPEPTQPKQTGPSWVEAYRMNMLMVDDNEQPRIGLMDVKKNISFTLGLNDDPVEGIRLKSIDYAAQSAEIEKGGDLKTIKMQDAAAVPVATAPSPPAQTTTSSVREKYLQRRAEMQKKNKQPPREPKYTGKELENHLREYQMEVLRNGLPPLPVPLTPEMDAKLVEEGVLPPLQADQP